jgi:hypothetical protein
MLQASVSVCLGDGATAEFWTDAWLPDGAVCRIAPNLFRAVRRGGCGRSVRDSLANHQWATDISGGPMAVVITEYLRLWPKVESIQLQPGVQDRFVWKWSGAGDYSSSSAYQATTMLGAKDVGHASTPPKVKFFFWLALHGRLWTAECRMRHGLQQHADCALCDRHDESTDHMLASCVYTREVWHRLLHQVGFQQPKWLVLPGALVVARP